jgi:2,3-dihydroxy-p-cumate/2,3-dihydroxybenzoate 3,4-dioxygenase
LADDQRLGRAIASYIRFDDAHHGLRSTPRSGPASAIEYAVENVDLLMQNVYFLQSAQVASCTGPGRRPTSNQLFVTFAGPDGVLFSYVAEGARIAGGEPSTRPRQFPRTRRSLCSWGSESDIPEFSPR